MSNDRRFGYGYPSYIGNAFQASCYDGIKFVRQQSERTAAQNAAFEKRMAESAAANQPVFGDPPRNSFASGGGSGAWADFQMGKESDFLNTPPSSSDGVSTYSARRTGHGMLFRLGVGIFVFGVILLYVVHVI